MTLTEKILAAHAGLESVFDPARICIVLGHCTPNKDIKSAQICQMLREFARQRGIRHLFDVGRMGIEHALLPEQGLVRPGPGRPRRPSAWPGGGPGQRVKGGI